VVAFQLSVLATGGIVWLSAPLAARLRGPELVRVAAATTIAAQLAVSPLLVLVFGPVPVAALPANLLAGPASGPIMMWGWTGGLVAGLIGEPVAGWLHTPTAVLVGWVRAVAGHAAAGPHITVSGVGIAVLGCSLAAVLARPRALTWMGSALAIAVAVSAAASVPRVPAGSTALGRGVVVHRDVGTVVVLDDPHRPRDVLEVLRRHGVRRVDLIVATDGDRADADAVVALRARFGGVDIVAPPLHRVPSGRSIHPDTALTIGTVRIESIADGDVRSLVVRGCAPDPCQDEPP
jgi:competence protein ComEC